MLQSIYTLSENLADQVVSKQHDLGRKPPKGVNNVYFKNKICGMNRDCQIGNGEQVGLVGDGGSVFSSSVFIAKHLYKFFTYCA